MDGQFYCTYYRLFWSEFFFFSLSLFLDFTIHLLLVKLSFSNFFCNNPIAPSPFAVVYQHSDETHLNRGNNRSLE